MATFLVALLGMCAGCAGYSQYPMAESPTIVGAYAPTNPDPPSAPPPQAPDTGKKSKFWKCAGVGLVGGSTIGTAGYFMADVPGAIGGFVVGGVSSGIACAKMTERRPHTNKAAHYGYDYSKSVDFCNDKWYRSKAMGGGPARFADEDLVRCRNAFMPIYDESLKHGRRGGEQ